MIPYTFSRTKIAWEINGLTDFLSRRWFEITSVVFSELQHTNMRFFLSIFDEFNGDGKINPVILKGLVLAIIEGCCFEAKGVSISLTVTHTHTHVWLPQMQVNIKEDIGGFAEMVVPNDYWFSY